VHAAQCRTMLGAYTCIRLCYQSLIVVEWEGAAHAGFKAVRSVSAVKKVAERSTHVPFGRGYSTLQHESASCTLLCTRVSSRLQYSAFEGVL
jgi:hypothetical protein